jgi:hypothetical protein
MHERDGSERGLARGSGIHFESDALGDRPLIHGTELHPEIVRMLPIVQRLTVVALAGLEQQRIPSS